jgi:hypothetical protein
VRPITLFMCDRTYFFTGLHEDGLFRRSPLSTLLRAAQEAYDRGNVVSLETFSDPHLAAVLLKKYLRDLPEPIFPERMYATIRRCPPPSLNDLEGDMASIHYIRESLLPELVPCAYILLSQILRASSVFGLCFTYAQENTQTSFMTSLYGVIPTEWMHSTLLLSYVLILSRAQTPCAMS